MLDYEALELTLAICTLNRAELLRDCLNSIASQPSGIVAFEVLVVDNGSEDSTLAVCAEYAKKLPGFRAVVETKTGLSHARNRAIAEAKGNAIAFIDDDAILCDGWLQAVAQAWNTGKFAAIGGPYDAWHRYGPAPRWFKDEWESNMPGWPDGALPQSQYPTGGNCVVSLEWCRRFDGFPTELGMQGNKIRYGEESLLFKQIQDAGAVLGWTNGMLIHHCVRPDKYGFVWRIRSLIARGRSYVPVVSPSFSLKRLVLQMAYTAYGFSKFASCFIRKRFSSPRNMWQTDFLDCGRSFFFGVGAMLGEFELPLKCAARRQKRCENIER